MGASSQFSDFLDGLGPAQLVGRQTLATPAIGMERMFSGFALFLHVIFSLCLTASLRWFPFITPSVLGYPGDIQIGMMEKKGQLEVEVIRARGLVQKPGSKSLPGSSLIHQQLISQKEKCETTTKRDHISET